MIKTKLIVRVMKDGEVEGGYVKDVELPFVPTVGMMFRHGISCGMWETKSEGELNPPVKHVIFDFDEECIVALFEIEDFLVSTFWTELNYEELGSRCFEMNYFKNI